MATTTKRAPEQPKEEFIQILKIPRPWKIQINEEEDGSVWLSVNGHVNDLTGCQELSGCSSLDKQSLVFLIVHMLNKMQDDQGVYNADAVRYSDP